MGLVLEKEQGGKWTASGSLSYLTPLGFNLMSVKLKYVDSH